MAGKTVKQLVGGGSGQSFMDRMNAAKYSVTGSGVAKVVCKATTEEEASPKKKHLEYLVQCTFEPNVSIPELANLLITRTQQSNWVVVFKALITIHNSMNYGNERFSQYLSTNNCHLSLSNFTDRTGVQAFDMSKFVRQYSRYVEQKARSYRDMGFDFCKIKRGKENGVLRKMSADKLMKSIPILEAQLDSMLDFDANGSEIHHAIVYGAFILLYKDAIRLFATYNDGMINLIEKYFSMNRKQCRDALNIYKSFTKRMDRVNKFLRLSEEIGCGDKDGLELQPVPPSVLEALENHLNQMEGGKSSEGTGTTTFNAMTSSDSNKPQSSGLTDYEKQKIINEEKAKLEEFAAKKSQNIKMSTAKSEPFLHKIDSQPLSQASNNPNNNQKINNKPSDDLILLGLDPDPHASAFNGNITSEVADIFGVSASYSQAMAAPNHDPFMINPSFGMSKNTVTYKEINFDSAFGGNSKLLSNEIDRMNGSDVILDASIGSNSIPMTSNKSPLSLDDKLASLAGNLDIAGPGARCAQSNVTSVNWGNSAKPAFEQNQSTQMKAGSINWNMSNNSTTLNQPVMPAATYGQRMAPMQNMPPYNQNYQGAITMPYAQNCYNSNASNPYYSGYGQQPASQYPSFTTSNNQNMTFVPQFQSMNPYSNQPNAQF